MKKVVIKIDGMTCASCASHVEKSLSKIGAKNISVNPVMGKAFAETDSSEAELKEAVKDAGYEAVGVEFEAPEDVPPKGGSSTSHIKKNKISEISKWKRKLIGVWLLTIPIMLFMYSETLFGKNLIPMSSIPYVMLALSFPIIFIFVF